MKNLGIVGVGFLLFKLFSDGWKVFTVRELGSKPEYFKEAGMISFPLETQKKKDRGNRGTILRLIEEEIGCPCESIEIVAVSDQEFNLIPGREDISTFYGFGKINGKIPEVFQPKDDDIEFSGWKSIEDLSSVNSIRIETIPILQHFVENHQHELN